MFLNFYEKLLFRFKKFRVKLVLLVWYPCTGNKIFFYFKQELFI